MSVLVQQSVDAYLRSCSQLAFFLLGRRVVVIHEDQGESIIPCSEGQYSHALEQNSPSSSSPPSTLSEQCGEDLAFHVILVQDTERSGSLSSA